MTVRRASIDNAANHLLAGGIACFPTDTQWSLSCLPTPEAVESIRQIKGNPSSAPLPVGFPSWEAAKEHVDSTRLAESLATRFLPGPLAIVVRRRTMDWKPLAPGRMTVAVRVPDHPLALELLGRTGPLVMTSARRHGEPEPQSLGGLRHELRSRKEPILVMGMGPVRGVPSTVVDATGDRPRVLREGVIPTAEVLAAWP